MNDTCLILYLSSTAMQADAARLRERRIPCEPGKPPASLTGGSCAYALRFPARELSRVRALTGAGNIYRLTDGAWRRLSV